MVAMDATPVSYFAGGQNNASTVMAGLALAEIARPVRGDRIAAVYVLSSIVRRMRQKTLRAQGVGGSPAVEP
jgi:hypothetical protein